MMAERLTRHLDRVRRRRHHSDHELLALIERTAVDAHLASCERCSIRHAELLCVIAEMDVVNAEADAAFDEQRLAHQRNHILRRLERNHGPARVLPFPAAAGAAGLAMIGRRWVAAAAIGGLVVGIFTGGLLRNRTDATDQLVRRSRPVETRPPDGPAGIVTADFRSAPDEVLLSELEAAVIPRTRPSELHVIDEFTPVAR